MTKQELELQLEELKVKLEQQNHLAKAVEAKDAEIIQLKQELELAKKEAKEGNKLISNQKDELIKSLNVQLQNVSKELETKKNQTLGYEGLKKQLDDAVLIANGYINNFRSYLKAQQGTLELAIELEALLAERLPKKQ